MTHESNQGECFVNRLALCLCFPVGGYGLWLAVPRFVEIWIW